MSTVKQIQGCVTCHRGPSLNEEVHLGRGHSTVLVGHLLLVFGDFSFPDLADIPETFLYTYNLNTKAWRKAPVPTLGRAHHCAVLVGDRVVIYGGRINWQTTREILFFDIVLMECEEAVFTESIPRVAFHTANYLPVRKEIIVFGGEVSSTGYGATYALNMERRRFVELRTKGKAPQNRSMHTSTVVGEMIYTFGGYHGGFLEGLFVLSFRDYGEGSWSEVETYGQVPRGRTFSCLNNFHGMLVLSGGFYNSSGRADMFVMMPGSRQWFAIVEDGFEKNKRRVKLNQKWEALFDLSGTVLQDKIVYLKEGKVYEVSLRLSIS